MATKSKKAKGWTAVLPKRVADLQGSVEKQVRKGLKQAEGMIPDGPSKALKRITTDVERVRVDVQKRADKVIADLRKRAEKALDSAKKSIEEAVNPLTKGLDLASKSEVDRLRKRLDHLEKRFEEAPSQHTPAVA